MLVSSSPGVCVGDPVCAAAEEAIAPAWCPVSVLLRAHQTPRPALCWLQQGSSVTHRVPDLQLDLLSINVDHARPKLHADGQVVHRLEPLVCELQQQA